MSRGPSGRIVLEVDPELKRLLYVELARERLTLKDWFVRTAEQFVRAQNEPPLFEGLNSLRARR
jgi:hypothetical protein